MGLVNRQQWESGKPTFRASLRADGVYELLVYDEIGEEWSSGGGITAKSFKQELDQAGTFQRISLRINSPGGDAFEGVAILNMLRAQNKPIDVHIDGLAASAATIIAMAGDTITMGSGAMMMIHNAWAITIGNAADHQKEVNALSAIDDSIAQTYVKRTGRPVAEVKAMMDAETWMGADECVEKGFATSKVAMPPAEEERSLNRARGFKALQRFNRVPARLQTSVKSPMQAASSDEQCQCDCQNCIDGKCDECTNAYCTDKNCEDCPMQAAEAAAANRLEITDELFADLAIPRLMSRMSRSDIGGVEVRCGSKKNQTLVFALRRSGSAKLNLASGEAGSSSAARVTGLLAPYNSASSDLGGFQEVYQSGCFNKWLAVDDPRVLSNHNMDHVLGRKSAGTARFWEEPDGLHYEADLPDTQAGRDLRVSMARGDIKESSAAFYILDYTWENRSGVRTRVIKEARLVEGSPHSFAAYGESTATPGEAQASAADHELEHLGARLQLLKIA